MADSSAGSKGGATGQRPKGPPPGPEPFPLTVDEHHSADCAAKANGLGAARVSGHTPARFPLGRTSRAVPDVRSSARRLGVTYTKEGGWRTREAPLALTQSVMTR